MKFKYLIVDDEPLARKLIASHASKIEGLELAGECGNAIEATNHLRNKTVDLIFLDVQMPEMTGFQFAGTLKNPPAIILTTAFRDYAPEAFDHNVVDYLLKPISFERFLKSVNRFFDSRAGDKNSVTTVTHDQQRFVHIKVNRKIHKVSETDILYIESLDNYVRIHLADKVLITYENISSLEEKLPCPPFVRIHRSFVINSQHVKSISSDGIDVNGKELPFGRAFKQGAMRQLGLSEK